MRCPVCEGQDLAISSREGVEIDYCPQCRGVWLDRGELDKIIDRAGVVLTPPPPPAADRPAPGDRPRSRPEDRERDRYDDDRARARYEDDRRERPYDPRRHRRRSFLDDLFDFD